MNKVEKIESIDVKVKKDKIKKSNAKNHTGPKVNGLVSHRNVTCVNSCGGDLASFASPQAFVNVESTKRKCESVSNGLKKSKLVTDGKVEIEVCEKVLNLEVSKLKECCMDGACISCEVEALGLMVSNCLIDSRVKRTPSMISHRSKVAKTAEFFKFEPIFGPRAAAEPPMEQKSSPKGNDSIRQKNSKLCPIFTKNVENKPTVGGPMAKPAKKSDVFALDEAKCRKDPPKKSQLRPKSTPMMPNPAKKFGRKPSVRGLCESTPSVQKQRLLVDYFSAAVDKTNQGDGFEDGQL